MVTIFIITFKILWVLIWNLSHMKVDSKSFPTHGHLLNLDKKRRSYDIFKKTTFRIGIVVDYTRLVVDYKTLKNWHMVTIFIITFKILWVLIWNLSHMKVHSKIFPTHGHLLKLVKKRRSYDHLKTTTFSSGIVVDYTRLVVDYKTTRNGL